MDFSLSTDQRELTETAAAFARQELNQDLVKCENAGEFSRRAAGDGRQVKCWQEKEQREGAHVETVINEYISQELVRDPALLPLADEALLLDSGILDSLSLLRLVMFVEERFGVTMGDDADMLPKHFASVNTICAYLRTQEAGNQQAARG